MTTVEDKVEAQICKVREDIELRMLDQRHAWVVEGLEPGDLSLAQGEWCEWVMFDGGAREWLERASRDCKAGERLEMGIFQSTKLLGVVSLNAIDRRDGCARIDYAMDARYRNQGIMTDACRGLLNYGFSTLGLRRIEIVTDRENLPARRIPEKLGFCPERVMPAHYLAEAGPRDCILYSMAHTEWRQESRRA